MASFLTFSSVTVPAATSAFFPLGGRAVQPTTTTEADVYWATRSAGTWDKLQVSVTANASSSVVVRFRKNSANGNQLVSPGAATGYFEDTSNSDATVAGDTVALSYAAATTSAVTIQQFACSLTATTNYVVRQGSNTALGTSLTTAGTDFLQGYHDSILSGAGTDDTTKAVVEVACTVANLYTNVMTNARTTTTSILSRKNNADGALTVSYTSGQTGAKEDTSHTDSLVAGDTINAVIRTAAADSNSIVVSSIFTDLTSATASLPYIMCNIGTVNANLTRYYAVAGRGNNTITNEADVQFKAESVGTFEKSSVVVTANTVTATSNFRMRVNTAPGNNLRSITASTTGTFTDTSNANPVMAADLVDCELTTGATGTSLAGRYTTITFSPTTGVVQDLLSNDGLIPFTR